MKKKVKLADLSDVFGILKTDMTGQEFKDEARKGWETKYNKKLGTLDKNLIKEFIKNITNNKNSANSTKVLSKNN